MSTTKRKKPASYWSMTEVCEFLGVTSETVMAWVRRGILPPPITPCRKRLFRADLVARALKRLEAEAAAPRK